MFIHTEKGTLMKRLLISTAVVAILAGCSSNPFKKAEPPVSVTPPVREAQTVAAPGKIDSPTTIDIPPWYIKAPAPTDEYFFVTGTGVSTDLSMSRTKAMLDAQTQLADKLNGMVDAVVRQSKKDSSGTVTSDYTSSAIKKRIIETSITGHTLEDSKVQAENRGYRTFVLVRYPVGDANRLMKEKLQRETQRQDSDDSVDKELGKTSAVTAPVVTSKSEVKLLDVDNEEYKKRREDALKKPGAVVGHITLR
jgi:hypothetical protein